MYMQFIMFKSNRLVKQAYNMKISQTILILYLSNNASLSLSLSLMMCLQ